MAQATLETIRFESQRGQMIDFNTVVNSTADKLGVRTDRKLRFAVTTYLNDLLRTGILAFGNNDGAWETQAGFLTDMGRETLKQASRDPINPDGYLKYLDDQIVVESVARGYIEEALGTYRACCYKATAILVGAAVEKLALDLRDELLRRLTVKGSPIPKGLDAWQVKTALEAVADKVLPDLKAEMKRSGDDTLRKLHEETDSRLLPIAAEFRRLRNSAGHPASLDPVDAPDVHANLLLFPATARLLKRLTDWVVSYYA